MVRQSIIILALLNKFVYDYRETLKYVIQEKTALHLVDRQMSGRFIYFSADVLCKYVSGALLHVRIYCYSVSIFCAIAFMQLEHRAIVVERNEFASVIQDRTGVPSLLKTASFCSFSALLSTL